MRAVAGGPLGGVTTGPTLIAESGDEIVGTVDDQSAADS
jgi:hypothetical protein